VPMPESRARFPRTGSSVRGRAERRAGSHTVTSWASRPRKNCAAPVAGRIPFTESTTTVDVFFLLVAAGRQSRTNRATRKGWYIACWHMVSDTHRTGDAMSSSNASEIQRSAMLRLLKPWLARRATAVLSTRHGETRAAQIFAKAFRSVKQPASVYREDSVGGRLMVECAALTVSLYRALLAEGLTEAQARSQTAAVTSTIYDRMADVPWLLSRLSAGPPRARLERATRSFRTFPFSAPAYVMEDVPDDARTVAFDVKRCPVAEYFQREGLAELCAESFCNLDFAVAEKWGAQLERTGTLAGGAERCDFRWRVPSSSNRSTCSVKGGVSSIDQEQNARLPRKDA
jgi:hypothetical protein